jgi:hypothetical protein
VYQNDILNIFVYNLVHIVQTKHHYIFTLKQHKIFKFYKLYKFILLFLFGPLFAISYLK